MKKPLIYGAIFGLIFGLIELITLGFDLDFYALTGPISFVAYIIVLILVLKQTDDQGTYSKRFLNGLLFSLSLGIVYGIVAGIAGYIFAENVLKLIQDGSQLFKEIGGNTDILGGLDTEPTPLKNLMEEFFGAILFNLFFGAIFSSIFANFIKPKTQKLTESTKPVIEV